MPACLPVHYTILLTCCSSLSLPFSACCLAACRGRVFCSAWRSTGDCHWEGRRGGTRSILQTHTPAVTHSIHFCILYHLHYLTPVIPIYIYTILSTIVSPCVGPLWREFLPPCPFLWEGWSATYLQVEEADDLHAFYYRADTFACLEEICHRSPACQPTPYIPHSFR